VEGVDEGHAVFGEAGDALAQGGGGGWHGGIVQESWLLARK
jgi:hypothetical protein